MIAAALLALVAAWRVWGPPTRPDLVLIFGLCVAVGEVRRIYLPGGETASAGAVFGLTAVWLLEPPAAALVEILGWGLSGLYQGSLGLGRWFNAAQTALAALAGAAAFAAAGGSYGVPPTLQPGTAYLAGGAAFLAVNSGLVALAFALHRRQSPLTVLLATYRAHFSRSLLFLVTSLAVADLYLRFSTVTLLGLGALVLALEGVLRYARDREFKRVAADIQRLLPAGVPARRTADRLVRYAQLFGAYLNLDEESLRDLRFGALLSAAGVAAMPASARGAAAAGPPGIAEAARGMGRALILANVARIVRHRHESWDGSGEPDGLSGEAIPRGARILAVITAFDALTSARNGGDPVGVRAALKALETRRGRDLDPDITQRFIDFVLEHEREVNDLAGQSPGDGEARLEHLTRSLREVLTASARPGAVLRPAGAGSTDFGAMDPALLLRLNAVLNETLSLREVHQRIADIAAHGVGVPTWVASYEGWGVFTVEAVRGAGNAAVGRFRGDPGPLLAAVTRLRVVEETVRDDAGSWAALLPDGGSGKVAAAPMVARGRVVGVVCAARPAGAAFSAADLEALEAIAGPAALALDNARLHEETRTRLAEVSSLKRFTDQVLDRLSVGVVAFAADGRLRLLNAQARELLQSLGLEAGRMERLPLRAWIRLHPGWGAFQRALTDEEETRNPALELRAGGEIRFFDVHVAPVHGADGSVIAAVGVAHEVTERQRLERQVREAERLAAFGQLAAGAAHEIRNPLTAIKGFIQLMREEVTEEHENLELVLAEIDRIQRLVNDLLLMARPSASEKAACDLNRLVEKVAVLLTAQAGQQQVRIETDLDPDLPPVQADSRQLRQVLFNLGSNAIEAMPDGGILRFETAVPAGPEQAEAVLRVSDTGNGIPPEHLGRLFEPFFTTKPRGTGLGLAVVYSIVRNHQGCIDVHTQEGRGTTFTVRLPVYDGPAPTDGPEVEER